MSNTISNLGKSICSIAGEYLNNTGTGGQFLRLQGRIYPQDDKNSYSGWIVFETMPGQELPIPADLNLIGIRPLSGPNIKCSSRHPLNHDCSAAPIYDFYLLWPDARLLLVW